MDTLFMNSENSKTSDPHSCEIILDLNWPEKYIIAATTVENQGATFQ